MLNIDTQNIPSIDRTIPHCKIIDLGSGDPPKFIYVQLPGPDGARVWAQWAGSPPNLAVDDYVDLQRRGADGIYKVLATDLDTPPDYNGWPFDDIKSVDSTDPKADYSTIVNMISGISAGQEARLNAEAFSESVTISKAITVRGAGPTKTLITDDAFIVLSVSAAAYIADLRVENVRSGSGALNAYGIDISGNDTVLRNVEVECDPPDATSGNCYGIRSNATGVRLEHCRAEASQANQTQHGLHVASGDVTVIGGYYSGAEADIYVDAGATAYLEGPVLNGLGGTGDVIGYYLDHSGSIFLVNTVGNSFIRFTDTGQNDGILYEDSGGSDRYAFRLDGFSNIVNVSNRAANGVVRILANTSTAGGGGETEIAEFQDDRVGFGPTVVNNGVQGFIHAHDGTSGKIFVTKTGVNGTAQTVIPNGAGDVTEVFRGHVVISSAGGDRTANTITVTNSSFTVVPIGGDGVRFQVNANGSFEVKRETGSDTYDVTIDGIWQ